MTMGNGYDGDIDYDNSDDDDDVIIRVTFNKLSSDCLVRRLFGINSSEFDCVVTPLLTRVRMTSSFISSAFMSSISCRFPNVTNVPDDPVVCWSVVIVTVDDDAGIKPPYMDTTTSSWQRMRRPFFLRTAPFLVGLRQMEARVDSRRSTLLRDKLQTLKVAYGIIVKRLYPKEIRGR